MISKFSKKNKMIIIIISFLIYIFILFECSGLSHFIATQRNLIFTTVGAVAKLTELYKVYNHEFTPKEEYYLGRTLSARVLKEYPLHKNGKSDLNLYITKIGHTLASASDRPETYQGYRFVVLKSTHRNAYAVPSGYIFITTGLLDIVKNEDELAAVMAHEVSHIALKHPMISVNDYNKRKIISELIQFVTGRALSPHNISHSTLIFGNIVDEIYKNIQSGYDSDKEKEADLMAVDILIRSGYNPHGFSEVLKRLKKHEGIHGTPNQRAMNVEKKISSSNEDIPNYNTKRHQRFQNVVENMED